MDREIKNIARLITENPDILSEEYCNVCGGWDKKQGGIGHKYGCKIGKEGTPIAQPELWQLDVSVPVNGPTSVEVYFFNVVGNPLLKKYGILLGWDKTKSIADEEYYEFNVGFDNKADAERVKADIESRYGSQAKMKIQPMEKHLIENYHDCIVDRAFKYRYHIKFKQR